MLLLSHLEPVVSDEINLGTSYILLSSAQEQIYVLQDCDIKYIKIFGRPHNYGMFSCRIEEVDDLVANTVPFYKCADIEGMYKHSPHQVDNIDLLIDWDR